MTTYTITARARNAYPGDTVMVMSRAHQDASGRSWPRGTEYQPLYAGAGADGAAQHVTIRGEIVTFA